MSASLLDSLTGLITPDLASRAASMLGESDSSEESTTKRQLNALTQEIMDQYRTLTDRVRVVKSDPESQNPRYASQVGLVEKRLRKAIQTYQEKESAYHQDMRERVERQFRIVRPDATEEEVRRAVEDSSNAQVFSQALMRNNRQAQANEGCPYRRLDPEE